MATQESQSAGPSVSELIERAQAVVDGWSLPADAFEHRAPEAAMVAALAHVAYLLGSVDRSYRAGQTLEMEVMARVHMEACLAAVYLAVDPTPAFDYLNGAAFRTMALMQQELEQHDATVRAEARRVRRVNAAAERNNDGIRRSNERDGTDIPLRPILDEPEGVQFNLEPTIDLSALEEGWQDELADSSAREVIDRIRSATESSGAPLDLRNAYSLGYRGLSTGAVHPSTTVLSRYLADRDPLSAARSVGAPTDDGIVRFAVYLTLMVAERVCEALNVDASWFSDRLAEMHAAVGL